MKSNSEQEPFSFSEFAAGAIALGAVLLIAYLGVKGSQGPNLSPANASTTPATATSPPSASLTSTSPPWTSSPAASPLPASAALAAPASSSTPVPRLHRPVRPPSANARSTQPPNGGVTGAFESDSAASNPPNQNLVGTNVTGAAAADSAVEASVPMADVSPPTDSRATAPSMPSLTGPMDVFHADEPTTLQPAKPIDEFTTLQPPKPTKEAAIAPPTPAPERTVPSHSDVVWIQTKLRDLGYFGGNTSHVWGAASRTALREFKKMNGLHEDDTWDNETEQRLLSKQNVAASNTFLGGWALDADECQHVGEAGAPLIIQS